MSLFQFKISSLNKNKDWKSNSHLGKHFASTSSSSFRELSEKHEELQDAASQFFIDESDLWNDEDKDVFEPNSALKSKIKLNSQKKSEELEENFEIIEKHNSCDFAAGIPNNEDVIKSKEKSELSNCNFNLEDDDTEGFDLGDNSFQNFSESKICFNLVEESDNENEKERENENEKERENENEKELENEKEKGNDDDDDIWLESPLRTEPSRSPTFHISCKPNKKSSFTYESKKDYIDSDSFSNCVVSTSSLGKNSEENTISFSIEKEKINSLGLAEETDLWLNDVLRNEAFCNVSLETPEEKLQNNLGFLNKIYLEILEKVMTAFESLPVEWLTHFPEFEPKVFMSLRTTRRRIKAVIIKTENLLKRKNTPVSLAEEKKNLDCAEIESPVTRDFSRLKYLVSPFDESITNKSSGGMLNFKHPTKSNMNSIMANSDVNFSTLSSPVSINRSILDETRTKSEAPINSFQSSTPLLNNDNSSTESKKMNSGMIDYTDMLYQTPAKNQEKSHLGKFHANMRNDGLSGEFDGMNFPHSKELFEKFRQKFGLRTFRPNQLQVMNAALLGHDCFVLMPTGGGKSLCYQLPAVLSKGVTVVISPLRSLILDQVTKLLTLDIAAAHLSGNITESEANAVYMKLNQPEPKLKLFYVTPEKVGASTSLRNCFLGLYKRQMLARFVIDEAHCISQWGHDFRPDYKKLRELRENYPDVKIMALTATATPRVRTDILHQLKVLNPKWFLSSFNRSNLSYSVKEKKGKSTLKEIAALIQNDFKKDTGVIYCLSRKECETVANDLKDYGITAIPYHAGLNDDERARAQNLWMNDKVKVVCATIAFGMGIDKLDVRFVIHYSIPKSIEGYYQESGRAGRDGEKATCILFYSYRDKIRMLKLINMDQSMTNQTARKVHIDNLFRMVAFAENKTDCRRALQLEYFGEKFNRKNCIENRNTACDNCLTQGIYETIDVTAESKAIVSAVKEVCGLDDHRSSNYTMLHFVDIFKGTLLKKVLSEGHDNLPMYGMGKSWLRLDAERLFRKLIMEEFLKERLLVKDDGITFAYIKFGRRGEELLKGNIKIMFDIKKRKAGSSAQASNVKTKERIDPAVLEIQEKCYSDLLDAIHEIASSVNCNPNAIMNVQALRAMSCNLPETAEEMLSINHVTTANFEKYGSILLEITIKYAAAKKALKREETSVENVLVDEPRSSNLTDDSPYFETEITFAEKNKKKKRKRSSNRNYQQYKKWRGGNNSSKGTSSKSSSWTKSSKGVGNGSGVTTVAGPKISTLMELPTNKARGFSRPKVLLKNL